MLWAAGCGLSLFVAGSVGAGARVCLCAEAGWESLEGGRVVVEVGSAMVLVRKLRLDVSAEGGGGSGACVLARHRKHSPVP